MDHYNDSSPCPRDLVMVINHLDHFSAVINDPSALPATLDAYYQDDFPALPRPGDHPLVKKDILVEQKPQTRLGPG